ncbi:uncharacterized protein LOC131237116 isoform X2 [Magnolia sinica]|uniref:uncharacterized protein LOC131237116 isoform X2 n=1 Tax=Magnolia sinica TaxID=86752 RepID=UPI0026587A48|nr:uncharacterized protein LOC131237116 isoform X2 [Magnolia sinica]
MATALLLWSSSKEKEHEDPENTPSDTQELKQESSKPRSKRASKSSAPSAMPKRPPQRGLGVAQLERLRLQERWKKLVESDPSQAQNLHFQFPFPVSDPSTSFSFTRFAPANYAALVADAQMRGRVGNAGFTAAGGDFSGVHGVFPDQSAVDRIRIAAAAAHEARLQMARELSSSQNLQCLSDQCEVCVKKRIEGENSGFHGWNNSRFAEMDTNGCDFLGLNLGGGRAIDEGCNGFGGRGERCGASSGTHVYEGVEVVAAAQRKGKCVGGCNVKEYEFFPGKGSSSRGGGASVAVSAADAMVGEVSSSSNPSSSFLDLSLKLSF